MPTPSTEPLPEGTDSIIAGASSVDDDDFRPAIPLEGEATGTGRRERVAAAVGTLREQATERTADLRGQAGDKARDFAEQGKERVTAALDNVSKMIGDAAAQVDEKVGQDYGDYARRAAETVDSLSATLREKDVDALVADARDLVRRSPGLALGAAAVVGFALVRLVKAGMPETEAQAPDDATQPGRTATGPKPRRKKA